MKLFLQALFISLFMTALLFWSMSAFTPASAKTVMKPIFVAITIQHGKPHLSQSQISIECKKNTPCYTVKNETRAKVYWWYDLGKCNPIPGACFQGIVLKPYQSKTFILNDQNSDCNCSTHIFRIWYNGGNNDMLDVHTF